MDIYLMRHGEAYSNEERFERPLNQRGRDEVTQVANFLKNKAINVQCILHSDKVRSIETAEIVANTLGLTNKLAMLTSLDPEDDVYRLIGDIHELSQNTLLVGHLPNLALLSSFLLTGNITKPSISFSTATVVQLMQKDNIWSLQWTMTPAALRNTSKN